LHNIIATSMGKHEPQKGTPRFLTEDRMSMTRSGFACVYCV